MDRITRVWKKIHVRIHGPFAKTISGNEFIISIADPFSKFLLAQASAKHNLFSHCAKFIFNSFCIFGFAQCSIVGLDCKGFEEIKEAYREKFDGAQDIIRSLVPLESENIQQNFNFSLIEEFQEYTWTGEMFEDLCSGNPNCWDDDLPRLLFHHSTEISSEDGFSPFTVMFGRSPTGYITEQEKENISIMEQEKALEVTSNRRKLRSSTLQCRHCKENFSSKISFRIHQRKHTEDAKRRGALDGEEQLANPFAIERKPLIRISRRKREASGQSLYRLLSIANPDQTNKHSDDDIPNDIQKQLKQSTIKAVKNLLVATKEERSKRGKYKKYSSELRDEIAQYAIDHSIQAATTYLSNRIGITVSESSIRNFIRSYKKFSPSTKDEIGKFAFHHGVDKALAHFREMSLDLNKGIVIKLKRIYGKKFSSNSNENFHKVDAKHSNLTPHRRKHTFSHQMRQEIGQYAYLHGISAAMKHYSNKLQFNLKECTVRKFKYQYIEGISSNEVGRNELDNAKNLESENPSIVHHTPSEQPPQIDDLNSSPSILSNANSCGGINAITSTANNTMYQHQYSINMATGGIHPSSTISPMNNNLSFHQTGMLNQGLPNQTYQQSPLGQITPQPTVLMNQTFSQVASPPFPQSYVGSFAPSSINCASSLGTPLAMTHTTISPASSHNNSSLQLTLGGAHLGQLSATCVAPMPHLGTAPQLQPSQSIIHQMHIPHTSLQFTHSTISQPITGNMSIEPGSATSIVNACHNLNIEPLSLMKENPVPVIPITHEEKETNLEDTSINDHPDSTSSLIHMSGGELPHMELQDSQNFPEHSYQHHSPQDHLTQPPEDGAQQHSQDHLIKKHEEITEDDLHTNSDDSSDVQMPKRRKWKSKANNSYNTGKRGNYVSYSPQLRAEIAQHASENGNLATISYFKEKLGIDIPESTVRGLKDKYLLKMMKGERDIKSLGFAQRGRPMRLGKYDNIVQDCIKELINSGEKISSFIVIATAKHVLMQYEPDLLEENGGDIKLNHTWAKSFLKRICVHKT